MRVQILIKGGRDGNSPVEDGPVARGQDIGVFVVIGEQRYMLPVMGLVLRCDGRKAVATVNLMVDEVELTSINCPDNTRLDMKRPA